MSCSTNAEKNAKKEMSDLLKKVKYSSGMSIHYGLIVTEVCSGPWRHLLKKLGFVERSEEWRKQQISESILYRDLQLSVDGCEWRSQRDKHYFSLKCSMPIGCWTS